jgi:hypothetical protein
MQHAAAGDRAFVAEDYTAAIQHYKKVSTGRALDALPSAVDHICSHGVLLLACFGARHQLIIRRLQCVICRLQRLSCWLTPGEP